MATKTNPAGLENPQDWMGNLSAYAIPTSPATGDQTDYTAQSLEQNIQNAPALERLSSIVNSINQKAQQQANLARTGGNADYDQAILENINRASQGYISPETINEAQAAAAQRWGTSGFGVDTPAWQSSVRRALGLQREDLQKQAAEQYATYLGTHPSAPIADITRYTVTPETLANISDAQRARQLQLAELQQKGALTTAELNQQRALREQELALEQQKYELQRQAQEEALKAQRAELYAKYGIGVKPYGYGSQKPELPTTIGGSNVGGYIVS